LCVVIRAHAELVVSALRTIQLLDSNDKHFSHKGVPQELESAGDRTGRDGETIRPMVCEVSYVVFFAVVWRIFGRKAGWNSRRGLGPGLALSRDRGFERVDR
jgi:hypothetical protein